MIAQRFAGVRPIAALLFSPRAFWWSLGVMICLSGLGWIVLSARFNQLDGEMRDALFGPMFAATFAVVLPAGLGLVIGETAHEVFRRAFAWSLPGVGRQTRFAALVVGVVMAALSALTLATLRSDVGGFQLFPLALLGYALGMCVVVRRLGSWFRLGCAVALCALAYLADPVSVWLVGRGWIGVAMCVLALVAVCWRFAAPVARSSSSSAPASALGVMTDSGQRAPVSRAISAVHLPRAAFGLGLRGAIQAHRYERSVASPVFHRWNAAAIILFACSLLVAVPVVLIGIMELVTGASWSEVGSTLDRRILQHLVGCPERGRPAGLETDFLIGGLFTVALIVAFVDAVPLAGKFLYPVGRRTRARLTHWIGMSGVLGTSLWSAAIGIGLSFLLQSVLGVESSGGLPLFVRFAVVYLVVGPWISLAIQLTRNLDWKGPGTTALGGMFVLPITLGFANITGSTWFNDPILAGSVVLASTGLSLLVCPAVLRHYFAERDLRR